MAPRAALHLARLTVLLPLAFAVAALAGCGGGGGGAPAAPTGFTAIQNPGDFDQVDFAWTPPAGAIDGYEAEGRLGAGEWQSLGGDIPAGAIGGTIQFLAPAPPELTEFAFRLRSVRGGQRSAWTPEAPYHRTLRPPANPAVAVEPDGLRLTWQNTSLLGTGVAIQLLRDGAWTTIASGLPATATTWLDAHQLVADAWRDYRILATAGAVQGMPVALFSTGYPATPVRALTATTEAGGVRLRWTLPPLLHAALVVHRRGPNDMGPGEVVAPLAPGATSYLDPAPPGAYTWAVEIRFADPGALGPSADVAGVAPPSGAPAWTATPLLLPEATAAARDGAGRLALAIGSNYFPPSTGAQRVAFHGEGAPPDHDLGENHGWAAPAVAFDAAGHPHAMVLRPVPPAAPGEPAIALLHAWHDGAAWAEEEVVRRAFDDPDAVRFAVGPGGALHAAWTIAATGAAGHAVRGAAGWTSEDLTAAWPAGGQLQGLAVDGAGAVHLLARAGPDLLLVHGAAWLAERVPYPTALAGLPAWLAPLPVGVGVLQQRLAGDPGAPGEVGGLLERTAAGWSPESPVWARVQAQPKDAMGAVASPDGARWLAWAGHYAGMELSLRDGGTWAVAATGLTTERVLAGWFDDAGKAGALVRTARYPGPEGTLCVIYQEP